MILEDVTLTYVLTNVYCVILKSKEARRRLNFFRRFTVYEYAWCLVDSRYFFLKYCDTLLFRRCYIRQSRSWTTYWWVRYINVIIYANIISNRLDFFLERLYQYMMKTIFVQNKYRGSAWLGKYSCANAVKNC